METKDRIEVLRHLMKREGVSAFIVPSTDPHAGEYIPERWKARRWISGFTGSAGTAVVTLKEAALWTDSRYFIQAAKQLEGTEFVLMKEKVEGTPTIAEWLGSVLPQESVVAIDGWVNTASEVESMEISLKSHNLQLRTDLDPFAEIWEDRPSVPKGKAFIQGLEYAGERAKSKIERIRQAVFGSKYSFGKAIVLSSLEEVAWTLNLRGDDVAYTPFVLSYAVITPTDTYLYICKEKVTPEVEKYLRGEGVSIREYDEIIPDLQAIRSPILVQPDKTNHAVFSAIQQTIRKTSPVTRMLSFKNETEVKGYRNAMEKDGVAMVKWMKWTLENVPKGGQTELSLAEKLYQFRAEQPLFKGISFESIMGYGPHGAIVHYDPTPETDIPVKPEGLLLIDSGGQYLDGTTDITRTLPLGPLTWEMRRDYTLVLRGWIKLGSAVFPKGTNGTQLDALAREAMWKYGINYLHGTGHGVGQFMSVHEAIDLHQFRMQWRPTPLLPGMTITDEPGIYIEGSHGVRHENTMLVVNADFSDEKGRAKMQEAQPCESGEAEGITFGPYYTFEHLTLCPILTSPIIVDMLSDEERQWFNNYQQTVYERLSPRLDTEHQVWLKEMTRPI
ncbi:MAG: aminopeptidase P family protein [Bacteroidales bacterium]|nr:aminopeptidase P family protein [Bacteroidales bacterium]